MTRCALVLLVALLAFGGAWCRGSYQVADRIADFADGVQRIGLERGVNAIPTEQRVQEQVVALAAEMQLDLRSVATSVTPLSDANLDRTDLGTRAVHEKLGAIERRVPDREAPGGTRIVRLEHTAFVIEVHATVHASSWPYSRTEQVDTTHTVGHQLQMR